MQKLLLFLLLLVAIYLLRRMFLGDRPVNDKPPAPDRIAESMRPCAHCGLLVPASEGVQAEGDFFCSPEHARAGRSPSA